VHAGLLADLRKPEHAAALEELGIEAFDLVVANLYPFSETVASGADVDECVEQIDIGGPSMVRASAKNHPSVAVVVDPLGYDGVLAAVRAGVSVVVGSSGLTAEDFAELDEQARECGAGVVASGNFSLTAAMCQAAALLAARHLPRWEILDYADAGKPDVPSGTARELAERMAEIREPETGRPVQELVGPREARGAEVGGTRVHSVRLPSFVVSTEVVFGLPDERLTIRHDAGGSPEPYVAGTLVAVRRAPALVGVTRGLDALLLGPA